LIPVVTEPARIEFRAGDSDAVIDTAANGLFNGLVAGIKVSLLAARERLPLNNVPSRICVILLFYSCDFLFLARLCLQIKSKRGST
jgi:hypothetical protein